MKEIEDLKQILQTQEDELQKAVEDRYIIKHDLKNYRKLTRVLQTQLKNSDDFDEYYVKQGELARQGEIELAQQLKAAREEVIKLKKQIPETYDYAGAGKTILELTDSIQELEASNDGLIVALNKIQEDHKELKEKYDLANEGLEAYKKGIEEQDKLIDIYQRQQKSLNETITGLTKKNVELKGKAKNKN